MRRQDKYKVIMEANLMLEQSYLKSKGLLKENSEEELARLLGDKYEAFVGLVNSVKGKPEVIGDLKRLSNDDTTVDEIEDVVSGVNESEEEGEDVKTTLQQTLFGAKYGAIAGSMTALPYLATIFATSAVTAPVLVAAAAMIAGGTAIGSVLTYLSSKGIESNDTGDDEYGI
jgi:hypothetical protein